MRNTYLVLHLRLKQRPMVEEDGGAEIKIKFLQIFSDRPYMLRKQTLSNFKIRKI